MTTNLRFNNLWLSAATIATLSLASPSPADTLSPDMTSRLQVAFEEWEAYGDTCNNGRFPSKLHLNGECDDGDATIFNGLLCLSSYQPGCDAVKDALGGSGQWWRSPRHVDGGVVREKNSFSRDQTMGVLAYLVGTGDTESVIRWQSWLKGNRKPVEIGPIQIGEVTRLCHDGQDFTCVVSPGMWESFSWVWSSIGLPPSNNMKNPYSEFGELGYMVEEALGDDWNKLAQLQLENSKPGYRMHLKGILAYIAKQINSKAGVDLYNWRPLAQKLNHLQPKNIFFKYLHHGISNDLAEDLLAKCPKPHSQANKRQWAWERADESKAWLKSMGWDCVFMANLLLKKDGFGEGPIVDPPKDDDVREIKDNHLRVSLYKIPTRSKLKSFMQNACSEKVAETIRIARDVTGIEISAHNVALSGSEGRRDGRDLLVRFDCQYEMEYDTLGLEL